MQADRLVGHTAHRQPAGGAEASAGELHAENRRRNLGVVAEHLEEVAEPSEDDGVQMIGLHGAILAKDRRVPGGLEVERCVRRLGHRRDEVRSPNLRARSHAAAPTGRTCN